MKTIEDSKTVTQDTTEVSPEEEKQNRLEMNRAAAMRSRNKKKAELQKLKKQVEELTEAKNLLELKMQQYESLLQASYRDNTLLKAHIHSVLSQNSSLLKHSDANKGCKKSP